MFGALKPGFRSLATLKLVAIVVGELQTEKNSCGIALFPCDSTALFNCYCYYYYYHYYYSSVIEQV